MKNKKRRVSSKVSKTLRHVSAVVQDAAELSIQDIIRRRSSLLFELGQVESEITEIVSKLADAKRARAGIKATLTGYGIAIERR